MTARGSLGERVRWVHSRVRDHRRYKYVSYAEAVRRFLQTRGTRYERLDFAAVRAKHKTSDTLFILGSGPSLNRLSQAQVEEINSHDTFGVNLSYLKGDIRPTYQQISWEHEHPAIRTPMEESLRRRRTELRETIFFYSDKALWRFVHPRFTPEFFPDPARVCFYFLPIAIRLDPGGDFTDRDFDRTFYYRGTVSLVLDLGVRLGYEKIVLLGIDPLTVHHFFDDQPEMSGYCAHLYARHARRGETRFDSMTPKGSKTQPIDRYYQVAAEYLRRRRGARLMVGTPDAFLHPALPAYLPRA